MPEELLRYDRMVEDALRGVVREALETAAVHGLPGEHHFYVTFRTAAAGVRIPQRLRARHPDEMTIVLQHQFWGLEVAEDAFEVTLSFGGVSERLRIPLSAISGFADPSAKFGLQFQTLDEDGEEVEPDLEPEEGEKAPAVASTAVASPAAPPGAEPEGSKVVALDAFRKK